MGPEGGLPMVDIAVRMVDDEENHERAVSCAWMTATFIANMVDVTTHK